MNQIIIEAGLRETVPWYLENQEWASAVNCQASGK